MNQQVPAAGLLRVLCLEDSPADAELVGRVLKGAGYEIEMDLATDRHHFESLLAGGVYDVILADYSLPGFDAQTALGLAKTAGAIAPFICVPLGGGVGWAIISQSSRDPSRVFLMTPANGSRRIGSVERSSSATSPSYRPRRGHPRSSQ